MNSLILQLPDNLNATEAKNLLAAKLYETGKLSMGQSAELAGFSKRDFMEILGNYGVSIFNLSEQDLEKDINNAKNYHL